MRRQRSAVALAATCIATVGALAADDPTLPKYGPATVPLSRDNAYLRDPAHAAPDYWALAPYYVPQESDYACSVASVAIVVNGLARAGRELHNVDRNATQRDLLEKVRALNWKARMTPAGDHGRHGLSLEQLAIVTADALKVYGVADARVAATSADGTAEGLAVFRSALVENERGASDALLVHFTQETVTGAPGGPYPHISPVGAYDAEHHRVLVLDVDRTWYEPYWVADDVLWRAMSRRTTYLGAGGFVWVRRGTAEGSR